jgi:diguanylate cyclase
MQSIGELKLMVAQLIEHTKHREDAASEMQNSLVSMTREMQQLKEEVARLSGESSIDTLTRIPTKSVFIEDLETHAVMARSDQEAISIVLLEVDDFKLFRSKFGDAIADKVLKFIATLFKKNLKGADTIARYGEQTFAMILPDTNTDDAHSVADNLRMRLAKQTLSDSAAKVQLGTITVSAAIASLKDNESAEQMLRKTESALSKAVKEGGNKVTTA